MPARESYHRMMVGIDLGTTKSAISVWSDNKPRIIPDEGGNTSIPSRVLVTTDGKIITGRRASRHSERYMATNYSMSSINRAIGEKGKWERIEQKICPQEIAAFILAELKLQAENYLGEIISDAVITIPCHFDESQCRAVKEAAKIAGLNAVKLLHGTSASGLAYGLNRKYDESIMIFDLGGGSTDIAVMRLGDGIYEVIYINGNGTLGGDDFDQVILQYIWAHMDKKYGSRKLSSYQYSVLKEAAEFAKIELSNRLSASIQIPGFIKCGNSYHDLDVLIDRKNFETLSNNVFETISEMLKETIEKMEIKASDLNSLLLLGAGSRIPKVKEIVKHEIQLNPVSGLDNDTCVAQGAGIMAGVLSGDMKNALLLEGVSASIGIETAGGVMTKLVDKNTITPTRRSLILSTVQDNQTFVEIHVIRGEKKLAADNESLGRFQFMDIPKAPKNKVQIEITIDIDAFNNMKLSAKDIATGKEQSMDLSSPYGLSDRQIEDMRVRHNSWLENPDEYRLR